uniref:Flavin-containing monooxygenase n=1 Tax=Trichogramma kaykai TaxID=54128 RepID=A0ABD2WP52_9HYME
MNNNLWWSPRLVLPQLLLVCAFLLSCTDASPAAAKKPKVCVIGAGVSGLAATRAVSERSDELDLVAFERNSEVGGLWIYDESQDKDAHGLPVHSSVYANLRTNLPGVLMSFFDFPYPADEGGLTCHTHDEFLEQMKKFADHFDLRKYIQFDTLVEKVVLVEGNKDDWRSDKWTVITKDLNTDQETAVLCDALMIGNGHYSKPRIPTIPNIEKFPGKVMHSHLYRHPEEFKGQTVLILGAGISGIDISIDVATQAKKVYLSHNHDRITAELPENVEQIRGLRSVDETGKQLILRDDSRIQADAIVFATGYLYDHPFLGPDSGLEFDDNFIYPLYKHMLNARHPSMALIGAPLNTAVFPVTYTQSHYFVQLLLGNARLPDYEARMDEIRSKYRVMTDREKKYAHSLEDKQWDYERELAKAGGFEVPIDEFAKLYNKWTKFRMQHLLGYKDSRLELMADGSFKIIGPDGEVWSD